MAACSGCLKLSINCMLLFFFACIRAPHQAGSSASILSKYSGDILCNSPLGHSLKCHILVSVPRVQFQVTIKEPKKEGKVSTSLNPAMVPEMHGETH